MINWIVDQLFKWDSLRNAIFTEVDFYNSMTLTLQDPEAIKTATSLWNEGDGWRGWTIKENGNYSFHDIPEKSLGDILEVLNERDGF